MFCLEVFAQDGGAKKGDKKMGHLHLVDGVDED
ncbi:MAG: hypothetical protein ACI8Z9_002061 [Paraglaciecola sp.]|jgi:hypothetical protein